MKYSQQEIIFRAVAGSGMNYVSVNGYLRFPVTIGSA